MRKTKLLTILALLLMAVTGAWAQETYTVTVKEGTADAEAVVTGLSGELRTENGEAAAAAWYTLDVIMGTGCLKGNPFHGSLQTVPSVFPTVISSDEPF